ncbi:MAG TPA: hypothetical protein VLV86_05590 [Vicinamibacterales bacterium]|nr:hypothetical protein [Vicinamibacterales bacterium]
MAEHFHERVLDGFVCLGCIAKVLEGDAQRAALMCNDEPFKTPARVVQIAVFDQFPNLDSKAGVV